MLNGTMDDRDDAGGSPEMMLEMARRVVAAQRARTEEECLAEVQAVLDQYGCVLVARPLLVGGELWRFQVAVQSREGA